jgi:hypothetical protein
MSCQVDQVPSEMRFIRSCRCEQLIICYRITGALRVLLTVTLLTSMPCLSLRVANLPATPIIRLCGIVTPYACKETY